MCKFRNRRNTARTSAIVVSTSVGMALAAVCGSAIAGENGHGKTSSGTPTTQYKVAEYKLSPLEGGSLTQPLTRVSLPPVSDLSEEANTDKILIIQSALVAKGCYDGVLDNTWDNRTQRVVARAAELLSVVVDTTRPSGELIEALLHPRVGDCREKTIIALSPAGERAGVLDDARPVVRRPLADVLDGLRPMRLGRNSDTMFDRDPALVTALQAALVARNCYTGPVSGRWTKKTWSALKSFASLSGILIDGALVRDELLETVLAVSSSDCAPSVAKPRSFRKKVGVASSRRRSKRLKRSNRGRKHRVAVRRRAPAVFVRPVGAGRF